MFFLFATHLFFSLSAPPQALLPTLAIPSPPRSECTSMGRSFRAAPGPSVSGSI